MSFVLIAQSIGLTLNECADLLARLPGKRTPTHAEWGRVAARMREGLDTRIAALERTRDRLDGCIGCGCLSLACCALSNADDRAARLGPGARFLIES